MEPEQQMNQYKVTDKEPTPMPNADQYRNFDNLMHMHRAAAKKLWLKQALVKGAVGLATVGIVGAALWWGMAGQATQPNTNPQEPGTTATTEAAATQPATPANTAQGTPKNSPNAAKPGKKEEQPAPVKTQQNGQEAPATPADNHDHTATPQPGKEAGPTESVATVKQGKEADSAGTDLLTDEGYDTVQLTINQQFIPAEPEGGYTALYAYFEQALAYPDGAINDSIEGTVTIQFSIGTDGRAQQVQVAEGLNPLLDETAIQVIKEMPPWKPATINGIPIATPMTIPLTFSIIKTKKPNIE